MSALASRRAIGDALGEFRLPGASGISFVAAAAGQQPVIGSGGILTCNVPTGVQDGDLMLAFVIVGNANNEPATPAGWTKINSGTAGVGPSVCLYSRVASSEPASYIWTVAREASAVIVAYRGASRVNANGAWNRVANTATFSATSITTTVPNCVVIFAGMTDNGVAGSFTTLPPPTGYTQRAQYLASPQAEVADDLQTAAGATGSVSTTKTGSGNVNTQSVLIAIAPA